MRQVYFNPSQSLNAFAAGQQQRERREAKQLKNAFGEMIGNNDFEGARKFAYQQGAFELGQGADAMIAGQQKTQLEAQERQAAEQAEDMRMRYGMLQELAKDPNQVNRWRRAHEMSAQLGIDPPTDIEDVSDRMLDQHMSTLRVQGGFEAEARQAPIKLGDRLIDPVTYQTLYEPPAEPQERQTIKGADGHQYYMDTGERVLPGASKPAPEPENPWSAVAMGDGNALLYNNQTGDTKQFSGAPVMAPYPQDFGGVQDEFVSPFEGDEFRTYNGGDAQFIPASFERGDKGGRFGDEGLDSNFVTGGSGAPTDRKPSEYDKVRDREMAKDLTEWTLGGQVQAASQLRRLKDVITRLESGENVSGKFVGNLPFKTLTAPAAKDVEDTVGSVVQLSLKAILGGQFAQQEADQLLRRAYDPGLDEKVNAKRLKILYDDLVYRAKMNDYAARYADQHGTLEGFDGYLPQIGDHFATEQSPVSAPSEMSDEDLLRDLGLN